MIHFIHRNIMDIKSLWLSVTLKLHNWSFMKLSLTIMYFYPATASYVEFFLVEKLIQD